LAICRYSSFAFSQLWNSYVKNHTTIDFKIFAFVEINACCIFLKNKVPERLEWPKICPRWGLVMLILGKKIPECCFGFNPSEKELTEQHSGAFHQKIPLVLDNLIYIFS
jgi:hypothetical protein